MSFDKLPKFPYNQKKGGDNMAVSEAKKRANKKWEQANCKQIRLVLSLEQAERLETHCKTYKLSKNGFIKAAIDEKLEREK